MNKFYRYLAVKVSCCVNCYIVFPISRNVKFYKTRKLSLLLFEEKQFAETLNITKQYNTTERFLFEQANQMWTLSANAPAIFSGFWNMFIWRRVMILICWVNRLTKSLYMSKQLQFIGPCNSTNEQND